jgi:AmmeMemoRadiSam system protein B
MSTPTVVPHTAVRPPAVAGRFYPADADRLRATVTRHMAKAHADVRADVQPTLRAVIAPHAGYVCSGDVAGHAFAPLRGLPDAAYTVVLIGPAHWVAIHGVALSDAPAFRTPLGDVPLNQDACAALLDHGPTFSVDGAAHAPEHALEVELPFLQVALPRFSLVPLLCADPALAGELCTALCDLVARCAPALVVVSSDLSHFHSDRKASARDGAFLHDVVAGDVDAARHGEACGLPAILALMMLAAQQGWSPRLLAYANSGDTCSDHRAVVGYGAVAYDA